jgi:hypothetical protein
MAFTLQDNNGSVDDANAYIDATFFKTYHKDRGNSFSGGTSTIQDAIVTATDYLDFRFCWVGEQANTAQRTQWPRIGAEDRNNNLRSGIPNEVKEACAEYARIALSQTLNPTPDRDDTGRAVQSKSERVGPIEESVEYASGASFQLPKYPAADQKLTGSGLAIAGKILRRA